ncbi:hypothetical protein OG308_19645 [Nocardia salmonicida]|uniref:Transcriptional regulator n=1 Tax=Nocardia salmonicida TaxID=53431 RepID=A0ABZ1N0T5_9NOCA
MSDVVDLRSVRTERRAQLGAFLKSRRAKITPGEVGLATGSPQAHAKVGHHPA